MANYIVYRNQGATRNKPLDEDLVKRLAYLEQMGVTAQVFSGGQDGKGEGDRRTGSVRHDHGGAGDMFFHKDGKQLDWNNPDDLPIFKDIVSQGKANGITGFGAGPNYMQPGSMHVGMGNPGVWGAGGKSDNAPGWLKAAYNSTSLPEGDMIADVMAAAPPRTADSPNPLMAAVQAKMPDPEPAEPAKPESRNGVLVNAFNKITGNDYQVPETILGADTGKFMKGVGGIGDFAKSMMEQDESINKQIQANARAAGRGGSAPVEIALTPTMVLTQEELRKKRRGGLSQLGGYTI
ncbi:hypothetical protein [Endobacterium cereale]|uniref:hypothetical protein n=1 Tax=Endobacterium cereale TaxID=2663029 RepID=UPI002B4A74F3|nr:hypothetical protein [Endobacterium cereale]MEB2843812.1 hypothetical protein [Endobacterium cereale]